MANHLPLLIILCFFFPILPTLSQIIGKITVGSSITATESSVAWHSPSGHFAFGFQPLQHNNNLFVLAVWFAKIPNRTIVWFDRLTYPVPRGSVLLLDPTIGLVLLDPHDSPLLNITHKLPARVAHASMNDAGNFILSANDSTVLWQSFSYPADTILPTQTIEAGRGLVSRKSQTDFSEGRFHARVSQAGDFVLSTKSAASNEAYDSDYFSSQTYNESNPGYRLVFDGRGSIAVARRNGEQQFLTLRSLLPTSEFYYRATIDFDGVFTQYYFPRNFESYSQWIVASSWPDNICFDIIGSKGSGACGFNNVCSLENRRPVCRCPLGFSLADPNNAYGDCNSNLEQSNCVQGKSSEYELLEIADTDWPRDNDYEQIMPSTKDGCKAACMNDCFCAVAIYHGGSCWKKKLPLSNGKVDTTLGATAFLKFRKGDVLIADDAKPKGKKRALFLLVGSVLLGNVLLISLGCLGFFCIYRKEPRVRNVGFEANSGNNSRCFSYRELVQATQGFKEELGRGAFGIVYKGVLPDENTVAVKKLDRVAEDSDKEFRTEVNVIGRTHHKNLAPLIGFCDQGPHRLLVYEYMSNGTLAEFLFGDVKPSWSQRSRIAFGIARGLTYLHEECSTQIIHCDIKPQNILLDENLIPRISDFGLAKLLSMDQSNTQTNIRGTKGYVAPDWFRNKRITAKVDVYSFGVLMLEIVSCRKNVDFGCANPILTDWVWECCVEGRLDDVVETDDEASSNVERFVRVGIWCIQEDACLRPCMRTVFQMLEGSVQVGLPPCPYTISSTDI